MQSITVFADVLCPFTHAGLHTLRARRAERGGIGPQLDLRAWPLELVNGQPLDAHHIAAEIVGLRATVCPELFGGFSIASFPATSLVAFRLATSAQATGNIEVVEEVGMALRDAVFEEGLDVSDVAVVSAVAARFGLELADGATTDAAVRADWAEGKQRGVIGSPHFFLGEDEGYFCPTLDISRDEQGAFIIDWNANAPEFFDRVFSERA